MLQTLKAEEYGEVSVLQEFISDLSFFWQTSKIKNTTFQRRNRYSRLSVTGDHLSFYSTAGFTTLHPQRACSSRIKVSSHRGLEPPLILSLPLSNYPLSRAPGG